MRREETRDKQLRYCILAMVFFTLTALTFIALREDRALTVVAQKLVYSLGAGMLLSGLVTLLLAARFRGTDVSHGWWFYPLMSALLSLTVMSLSYTHLGMWPLGERSAMIVDMHHQYAPLLAQWRSMLLSGDNMFYSFEVGLGTGFLPLFAYYLASPFNLLLMLFPYAGLTEGVLVITLLKNALSAFCFAACVQYVYHRRDLSVPAVSLMYSMMMYLIAYSWNIMWLDCVMVLPLIVMGFERLMRKGRYLTYVLPLTYALYCNYYIGFMVCVFLVLYWVVYQLRQPFSAARCKRSFGRFAIGSLLAGGLAMGLLIPVISALGDTSAAGGKLTAMTNNFNLFQLLGRHLYGGVPTIRSGNLPNIYCGILAVVTLPIYLSMRSIPRRRRLAYFGLWAVMACSMVLSQPNLLWHGLHVPNDLPYRFSFLYSFVLLLIAFQTLAHMREIRPRQLIGTLGGLAAYLVIEEQFGGTYDFSAVYVSLGLILLYVVTLALVSCKRAARRTACALLLLVVTAEMLFHGNASLDTLNGNEHFTAHGSYVDNDATASQKEAVDRAKALAEEETGGDFYRMEFLPRRTIVDTALYDYRGLTVFASSNSERTTKFVLSLGYPGNGINSHLYKTYQPVTDSLFGIRYLVLDEDASQAPYLVKKETVLYTGENGSSWSHTIYENTAALPLGCVADRALLDWTYTKYDPITSQEDLYTAMTGDDRPLYVPGTLAVDSGVGHVSSASGTAFTVSPVDNAKTAVFTATAAADGRGYVYVDCGAAKSISVSGSHYNGSASTNEPYMLDMGDLTQGDTVKVTITADSVCSGNIYLVTLKSDVFEDKRAQLADEALTVTSCEQTRLEGSVTVNKAGVLFTSIVYDDGWTAEVDGRRVSTYAAADAMLAFDVEPGTHTVVLTFRPKGLTVGLIISLISLAALVLWVWFLRKKVRPDDADEFAAWGRLTGSRAPVTAAVPETEALSEEGGNTDDHRSDAGL